MKMSVIGHSYEQFNTKFSRSIQNIQYFRKIGMENNQCIDSLYDHCISMTIFTKDKNGRMSYIFGHENVSNWAHIMNISIANLVGPSRTFNIFHKLASKMISV